MPVYLCNVLTNSILVSGAGVSVIDAGTLLNLNLSTDTIIPDKRLVDASGDVLNISDKVFIDVRIPQLKKQYRQPFYVSDGQFHNKVLLSRE